MREETKAVKKLLHELWPNNKFYIRFKQAANYVDSSDTIKVQCENTLDECVVIDSVKKYVDGICVFKKGQFAAISEREIEPWIKLPSTGELIDLNMVEFIEISQESLLFTK